LKKISTDVRGMYRSAKVPVAAAGIAGARLETGTLAAF
jgi:hypothetical protein